MFEILPECKSDPILQLMADFRNDQRAQKTDLGVGVYKDENGITTIMDAVKQAELQLHRQQSTKSYISPAGDTEFSQLLGALALGDQFDADRYAAIQAPGGSGALRLLLELVARANPAATVWVSTPTWGNHNFIALGAGLKPEHYDYFDADTQSVNFSAMLTSLKQAKSGDVVLIHGCCHNPAGADLVHSQWQELTQFLRDRNLIPLVDLAYMGFGDGITEDTAGLRHMVENLDEVLIALSCSKIFAIYRERTGCAMVMGTNTMRDTIVDTMKNIARANHSMPPDHGAALVRMVLADPVLRQNWSAELDSMRNRLNTLRKDLADVLREKTGSDRFAFLASQKGMFSLTGATPEQAHELKEKFGIYIVDDGRINIAGLPDKKLDKIADAFIAVGM